MPPTLRPMQQKLRADVYNAWNVGAQNVMMASATGSGKTVVLSAMLQDEPGASVAIAHRQELISQIAIALAQNGVRHRILGNNKALIRVISAIQVKELGYSYIDANAKTAVGGVDTVVKMSDPFFAQVRLQVQDEAHHVLAENKWGRVALKFPNARGLFPTATPQRADGRGLGRHADGLMDALVCAPSMREIINMGYLTDYRIFAPPSNLDLSKVAISKATGDFNQDQVRDAVHKSQITGDVISNYLRIAPGKLGVTFAVDVEEATRIATEFKAANVPAEVVSAKTPDMLRRATLRRFANREIMQLVNVDLFGEGFDLPAIECVSFARPTESLSLFMQQFGRVLRLMLPKELMAVWDRFTDAQRLEMIARSDKPYGIVIDHVNNVLRHGLPDAPREWSLDRRERRTPKKPDGIPVTVCVACLQVFERTHKTCPYCGHYEPPAARSAPEYIDGDLTEFDPALLAAMRGEITRIDGDFHAPRGLNQIAELSARKLHIARQQAQGRLRNAIAWWAGLQFHRGNSESESYRKFYFEFGLDVASAQCLGAREADELTTRINSTLAKFNIDGNVNAELFFTQTDDDI